MKPVFNTGKVLVGIRYEPPKNYWISQDMERLQRALLARRSRDPRPTKAWVATAAVAGLLLLPLLR